MIIVLVLMAMFHDTASLGIRMRRQTVSWLSQPLTVVHIGPQVPVIQKQHEYHVLHCAWLAFRSCQRFIGQPDSFGLKPDVVGSDLGHAV